MSSSLFLGVSAADAAPAVVTWLATYLLHSTLIFAAVWLLQWRAGARVRDLLWKVSLVLPLATTTARMLAPDGGAAPQWALPRLERAAADESVPDSLPFSAEAPIDPAEGTLLANRDGAGAALLPSAAPAAAGPIPGPIRRDLLVAWAGALALLVGLVRLALPLHRLRSRLRSRRLLESGPAFVEVAQLSSSARLARRVSVYELDGISSPMAAGTLRPAIYLPPRAAELPVAMLRSLLAHELAHHARFDPLWSRVAHATVGLLFFQPLHRIARSQVAGAAELLADDQAVRWTGDAEGLASCLAEVASWIRFDNRLIPGVPMVRAAKRGALFERIERAFDRPREAGAGLRWPLTAALAAATLLWLPSLKGAAPEGASNPYLEAMAPSVAALGEIDKDLDALPEAAPQLSDLKARLAELQQQAEALRASVDTSPRAQ